MSRDLINKYFPEKERNIQPPQRQAMEDNEIEISKNNSVSSEESKSEISISETKDESKNVAKHCWCCSLGCGCCYCFVACNLCCCGKNAKEYFNNKQQSLDGCNINIAF